ncbi:MAG: hypothetical protein ACTSR1_01105 [Candidatus Heimdallarchaeota archaeon]
MKYIEIKQIVKLLNGKDIKIEGETFSLKSMAGWYKLKRRHHCILEEGEQLEEVKEKERIEMNKKLNFSSL